MSDNAKRPAYQPDHNVREVFADAVTAVGFDGANIRLEFAVTRPVHNSNGRESTLHPAARVVLPLGGVNELMQKLGQAMADLERQGVLRKGTPGAPPASGQTN